MNVSSIVPPRESQKLRTPLIDVEPVAVGEVGDLAGLRAAFSDRKEITLNQSFPGGDREAPPAGSVRLGWSEGKLHILAELEDDHIYTSATQLDQLIYLLGDSFEVFLKAPGAPAYLECQIAPNNVSLQLLFPSQAEFSRYRHSPEPEFVSRFGLSRRLLTSRVWVDAGARHWTVFASVDLAPLLPAAPSLDGDELDFLFARYDYRVGEDSPILSCTSELSRLDFHSIPEWGRLVFNSSR